jgi:hypothetical protein
MKGHYSRYDNKRVQRAIKRSCWRKFVINPKKPQDIVDYEDFMREKEIFDYS